MTDALNASTRSVWGEVAARVGEALVRERDDDGGIKVEVTKELYLLEAFFEVGKMDALPSYFDEVGLPTEDGLITFLF